MTCQQILNSSGQTSSTSSSEIQLQITMSRNWDILNNNQLLLTPKKNQRKIT